MANNWFCPKCGILNTIYNFDPIYNEVHCCNCGHIFKIKFEDDNAKD